MRKDKLAVVAVAVATLVMLGAVIIVSTCMAAEKATPKALSAEKFCRDAIQAAGANWDWNILLWMEDDKNPDIRSSLAIITMSDDYRKRAARPIHIIKEDRLSRLDNNGWNADKQSWGNGTDVICDMLYLPVLGEWRMRAFELTGYVKIMPVPREILLETMAETETAMDTQAKAEPRDTIGTTAESYCTHVLAIAADHRFDDLLRYTNYRETNVGEEKGSLSSFTLTQFSPDHHIIQHTDMKKVKLKRTDDEIEPERAAYKATDSDGKELARCSLVKSHLGYWNLHKLWLANVVSFESFPPSVDAITKTTTTARAADKK